MVFLLPVFLQCYSDLCTDASTTNDHAEWSQTNRPAQLDATHGPNVDLGSSSSGGMALTISSLAEYTSYFFLTNVCMRVYI
jgi:hypothetical protein